MLRSFILFAGLVLALGLAGCPQQAEEPAAEDTEMVEVEEEVVIEEAPDEMPADSDYGEVNSGNGWDVSYGDDPTGNGPDESYGYSPPRNGEEISVPSNGPSYYEAALPAPPEYSYSYSPENEEESIHEDSSSLQPSNVDRLLAEMEFGAIAFNAPTNINIDDSPQIQLILSLAETVAKLKQPIAEEGEKIGATIKVSERMEAHLSGYKFQITPITPEVQAVSKSQRTEWKWELHPKEEGKHELRLTLTALLEINGYSTPRAIRTFDKIIEVNVTPAQKIGVFFKGNWKWLWVTILVPLVGWLWRRRKKQPTAT
ncbi:MAG: hypothetical protein IH875_09450, partial [Candidatus Dadabacteria bacterium]|nr:hypothetical protein [Candidatus Dadabacteria bacterium]